MSAVKHLVSISSRNFIQDNVQYRIVTFLNNIIKNGWLD